VSIGTQSHGEHNKIWEECVGQPHRCVTMSAIWKTKAGETRPCRGVSESLRGTRGISLFQQTGKETCDVRVAICDDS
jgi:hypothetical protein